MTTSAEQIRTFRGPAILSYGFRPFFLFGALWAALALPIWLAMLLGYLTLPTAFAPIDWHAHELIFGYVPAIAAGFLLTAVPNWTGRLPVVGMPLLILFLAWLSGRFAILVSAWIGAPYAAAIDLLFLAGLGAVIAREIIAGNNTRNIKVLAVVILLWVGNALFHFEHIFQIDDGHGKRLGIAATIFLILLIGGRIIPSFTRNWLARRAPGRLPTPFDRFDLGTMAISGVALGSWIAAPAASATALLATLAAGLNFVRLGRWAGDRTLSEPLVLILHLAYAFVPLGFLLLAMGIIRPDIVAPTGAVHGWTAGAIGVMTLAVMTRATLGHTGQELTATSGTKAIYALAVTAALARIFAAFDLLRDTMLVVSAATWFLSFVAFAIVYGPLLASPRK